MILVGNQRGGAKDLAQHLLKQENEHVDVHELRGFVSGNLTGALNEAYAVSRATRCKQFLFSLSLNPPPDAQVSTQDFEQAIGKVEDKLELKDQPRAIVFHEKEGRRHCHAVWSRINADEMKAVQLSHSKRKLQSVARDLFLEYGWDMPPGLSNPLDRNPKNFTLEEWQQAKRIKKDPREIKATLQHCWQASDSRKAFAAALEERGYKLAKGDRRGFVAVDRLGEVYAVARWVGIKTKAVRESLGDENDGQLPTVDACKQAFAHQIGQRLEELRADQDRLAELQRAQANAQRKAMVDRHRHARRQLKAAQQARWKQEVAVRQARYNRGLLGLWDRLTGTHNRIKTQNEHETLQAHERDQREKDTLIFTQLEERQKLQQHLRQASAERQVQSESLQADLSAFRTAAQQVKHTDLEKVRGRSRRRSGPERGL